MDLYKEQLKFSNSQTGNRIIEKSPEEMGNDEDQENNNTFIQFCININNKFEENDLKTLVNEFNEFDNFIIHFSENFFENVSPIVENNIPFIFFDCLHMDKSYSIIHSCICLFSDLLFCCQNVSQLFCNEEFLTLIIENIKSSKGIIRNEHIKALSNILLESDDEIHNNILGILPCEELFSIIASNEKDVVLIENSLNLFDGITIFPVQPQISQKILFLANMYISDFSFKCLQLYKNLVRIQNIYDGFNYQCINDILAIKYELDNNLINECCLFIHLLLKHNLELKRCFDVEKVAFFAIIPVDSEMYDKKLKYNALIALYDIGIYSQYIKTLMIQFSDLSNDCKLAAGNIIFDFAQKVNAQNANLLVTNESNIFSVALNLLNMYYKPLMISIFMSMKHFFEITQFSQDTVDMFLAEFPDDTIWHFIETDDNDIHQAGLIFQQACLSEEEEF